MCPFPNNILFPAPHIHHLIRRLEEARDSYQKVLELDARHSIALGFLGMVHHLMRNVDKAIVKYHEVCPTNDALIYSALDAHIP